MANYQSIQDPKQQRHLVNGRLFVLGFLVVIMLGVLLLRYSYLQIDKHEKYATLSEDNRVHLRIVPPTRGLIFDRNGTILAENRPSYTLSIVKERVQNQAELLQELQHLLAIDSSEIERFERLSQKRRRPYQAIPLRFQLSERDVAVLAVNEHRLQGIEIQVELLRYYPLGEYVAHSVGYVGRINEREQANIDDERYTGTHVIGKVGIEKYYEDMLHGYVGFEHVETDARGNVLRVLERQDPIPGKDLHLNIDADVQVKLQDSLAGERASAVAIEVDSGAVVALVSTPSYDPNLFVNGISSKNYKALLNDIDRPLFNRSLQGQYPPGSTVKPLYALIGLHEQAVTPAYRIRDPGFFQLPGKDWRYRDWKKEGHGIVDMRIAIMQSCDTYFYDMGMKIGIEALSRYGRDFGLGQRTNIDVPSERRGIMPSREWKRGARGLAWYPGDTVNTSIGQGFSLATPLQLAHMTANMASRGEIHTPKLLGRINNELLPLEDPRKIDISDKYWDEIFEGMKSVVHHPRGTANKVGQRIDYQMAGKTGTAQVISIAQDDEYDAEKIAKRKRDHALFVAFSPIKRPELATAIIVENGEHGSSTAAPIAKVVFDAWYSSRAREAAMQKRENQQKINNMAQPNQSTTPKVDNLSSILQGADGV